MTSVGYDGRIERSEQHADVLFFRHSKFPKLIFIDRDGSQVGSLKKKKKFQVIWLPDDSAHWFLSQFKWMIKRSSINPTTETTLPPSRQHLSSVTDKTLQETLSDLSLATCCRNELAATFSKSLLNSLWPQLTHLLDIARQSELLSRGLS